MYKIAMMAAVIIGLHCTSLHAQLYKLKSEKELYSFRTTKGKRMSICVDKDYRYIVYRYGSLQKIELTYPAEKDTVSWQKFKYSGWLRGGGVQNEGIDLNYLAFINNGKKYVVYHCWFANGNKERVGVRVYDLATHKMINIPANPTTTKGTLTVFRDEYPAMLIGTDGELYD